MGCIYYINAVKPYKFSNLLPKYPTNIPQNAVRLGASLTLSWPRWFGSSSRRVPCFMGAYITLGHFWAPLRSAVITAHQLRFRWLKRLLIVTPHVRSRQAAWHRREVQVAGCDPAWSGITCISPLQSSGDIYEFCHEMESKWDSGAPGLASSAGATEKNATWVSDLNHSVTSV